MKKKYFIFMIVCVLPVCFSAYLIAQISQGGIPLSFTTSGLSSEIDVKTVASPDMESITMADLENNSKGTAYRIGVIIPVHLNPYNSGTWDLLSDGNYLWRLQIEMEGAEASNISFDRYNLAPGCKLFVYSTDKSYVIGAFTEFNNHESGLMATQMIPGGSFIIELYVPYECIDEFELEITEVGYFYRSTGFITNNKDISCMVNVACPEGNNWQSERRGVARTQIRIGSDWFLCCGSLVATTNNFCQPYFLLADHCAYYGGWATTADLNQWVFHFNYRAGTCTGSTGPTNQTMTGCALKAQSLYGQTQSGSDFYLVLLNNNIPNTYQPYYNGWDRGTAAATSGVSIHHPEGAIMKISTFTSTLANFSTHWRVNWASTVTNHSVTAQGSSGGPIFNQNKLLVGTLTGGSSFCTAPNDPDYYGKFAYHWQSNGTADNRRLRPWLDSFGTNPTTKTGVNFNNCSGIFTEELMKPNLNINVFPNPASDIITIKFENYYFENGTIKIYDILGNIAVCRKIENYQGEFNIPVVHLTDGIYYVYANDLRNTFSKSFVISK